MSDFGCVVMVETVGFHDALDLRSERKRVKDGTKFLAFRSGRIWFLLDEMGKT